MEWITVTGSDQSFTRSSCNYQPYTNVTCIVAVLIKNGPSQIETRSAYTSCASECMWHVYNLMDFDTNVELPVFLSYITENNCISTLSDNIYM